MFGNKQMIEFKRTESIQGFNGGHLIKDGEVAEKILGKRWKG